MIDRGHHAIHVMTRFSLNSRLNDVECNTVVETSTPGWTTWTTRVRLIAVVQLTLEDGHVTGHHRWLSSTPKSGEGDEGLRSPVANVVPGEWRTQWPWKIPVFFGYQLDPQRLFQCRICWESHGLETFSGARVEGVAFATLQALVAVQKSKMYNYAHIYM